MSSSDDIKHGNTADNRKLSLYPVGMSLERIVLYKSKTKYYIIGSNQNETQFRILKVDRTLHSTLSVLDDGIIYDKRQIHQMLHMIVEGCKTSGGIVRTASAFSILGFVKFLDCYYLILIIKRRRVALIGSHRIYKIEDTQMIPVSNSSGNSATHSYETRYARLFQNVDLSSNFYFSYTYDLTHSLQYNMVCYTKWLIDQAQEVLENESVESNVKSSRETVYVRPPANGMFVWNDHLLRPITRRLPIEVVVASQSQCDNANISNTHENNTVTVEVEEESTLVDDANIVHRDWILPVIHGFFAQSNLSVFGRPLYFALMCRRSRFQAGTRFLKRGANDRGHVANDVETEQILFEASVLRHNTGLFSSFVQMRGSIPLYWSQDNSNMAPKPPIILDRVDPFYEAAALHFNHMFKRYGSPIVVLNLVKKKEKKPRESILFHEFSSAIHYLNQFLPKEHCLKYIAFDMAKCSHSKDDNVIDRLENIAAGVVKTTGFFHSGSQLYANRLRESSSAYKGNSLNCGGRPYDDKHRGRLQVGVLRINCIDCLDRTNAVEFMVGKCALAHQLYALGVIESPKLEFDCDVVRLLEEMYEDHGDTIALQYGGSQLVNTMETYRKISPWTSHSRDILHTIHRYYSNSFTDTEKQDAINVFLGIFQPSPNRLQLWELNTDYYLHNFDPATGTPGVTHYSYITWYDDALPLSDARRRPETEIASGSSDNFFRDQLVALPTDISVLVTRDRVFDDHYQLQSLTALRELFSHNMSMINHLTRAFAEDPSPFKVRERAATLNWQDAMYEKKLGVKRWIKVSNPSDSTIRSGSQENLRLYSDGDRISIDTRSDRVSSRSFGTSGFYRKGDDSDFADDASGDESDLGFHVLSSFETSHVRRNKSFLASCHALFRNTLREPIYCVEVSKSDIESMQNYVSFTDVLESESLSNGLRCTDSNLEILKHSLDVPTPFTDVSERSEDVYSAHVSLASITHRQTFHKCDKNTAMTYDRYVSVKNLVSTLTNTSFHSESATITQPPLTLTTSLLLNSIIY